MGDRHQELQPGAKKSPLLEIRQVTKRFAGVLALDRVDMAIYPNERISLIGPNGSGKTTLFNCITGFYRPEGGQVIYKGADITHERPDEISLAGIARTFQNVRIFPSLTVAENLAISLQQHQEEKFFNRIFHTGNIRRLDRETADKVDVMLGMVGLAHLGDERAASLVYGHRKLLEFACALIPDPDLIMLDEPAAGVNTAMVDEMKQYIMQFNQQGKTFLIVEHNMGVVMDISQRIVVLDYGEKIAEGTPAEIRENPRVGEAYFGK